MAKYDNRGSKIAEAPPATSFTNWVIKRAHILTDGESVMGVVYDRLDNAHWVRLACMHWARGEQIIEGTCRHGC